MWAAAAAAADNGAMAEFTIDVRVSPGPIGVLLCKQVPGRAIVVGFAPLPSGVEGEVQQDGRIEPGFVLARINGVDTSAWSLARVQNELQRTADAGGGDGGGGGGARVIGFTRAQMDATVRAAAEEVHTQQQFNIYARVSARTQFFRTWKRAFFVFELPTALSVYRDKGEWERRVSRGEDLDTSTVKIVLLLADAEAPLRVGAVGLRTYRVADKQLQLYKFKVELGARGGLFGKRGGGGAVAWSTVAKFGHPSEGVVRALRSRLIGGGGLDAEKGVAQQRGGGQGAAQRSSADGHYGLEGGGGTATATGGGERESFDSHQGKAGKDSVEKYDAWGTIDMNE